jgi:2,3-bisphosphoglycerate-dependent phosphoglycerate mutase
MTGGMLLSKHHSGMDEKITVTSGSFNIVFLRHGQSTWNRDNRFIGWTDTPLTEEGVLEARAAGQVLVRSGIRFDEVHTSLLRRAIRTTNIVLMELGQEYIPVYKHYRLNERMYGSLVGLNKKECVKQFGKEQVKRWRRSYDEPPPEMDPRTHPYWPGHDPRYKHVRYLSFSHVFAGNHRVILFDPFMMTFLFSLHSCIDD